MPPGYLQYLHAADPTDTPVDGEVPVASSGRYVPTNIGTVANIVTAAATLTSGSLVIGQGSKAVAVTTTGTGVVTALGVNTGSAGAVVVNGGALGTPASGTLSNCTTLPISTGVSGLGTGVATALGVATGGSGGFAVNGVAGVANGYKIARGVAALDGSNPTTVNSGLTTVVSVALTVNRNSDLTLGTAFVTYDNFSSGSFDIYAWILAGTASTGTENVAWIAVGT